MRTTLAAVAGSIPMPSRICSATSSGNDTSCASRSLRDAVFVAETETAPTYRLYAMAGSVPPKPALVHDESGAAIKVEVYDLDVAGFGSFVAEVRPPLAIGTLTLADGSRVRASSPNRARSPGPRTLPPWEAGEPIAVADMVVAK